MPGTLLHIILFPPQVFSGRVPLSLEKDSKRLINLVRVTQLLMKELVAETQFGLTAEHYMSNSQSFHAHQDHMEEGLL